MPPPSVARLNTRVISRAEMMVAMAVIDAKTPCNSPCASFAVTRLASSGMAGWTKATQNKNTVRLRLGQRSDLSALGCQGKSPARGAPG